TRSKRDWSSDVCSSDLTNSSCRDMTSLRCNKIRQDLSSVPIPKFAHPCGSLECKLRNQRDTSNSMILVPLLNPKFANPLAARRRSEERRVGKECRTQMR